ncbi:unannotated protein [freshwater metagenome]|uniref:Unannotated protein n=1 Tax=freshwater metagenome TaxID=449393 RepID=A0A6J7GQ90_9ZZZZ|nr:2-oxo acid dehydrogenase subunit E2 [Actinomycetota bacterium]
MSSSPTDVPAVTGADVLMPRMGTSVAEGTVVAWHVAVGDPVARDQVLCEVSTDKVDVECPAPADGVLAEILVPAGETVDVGVVIARLRTAAGTEMATDAAATTDGPAPVAPSPAPPVDPRQDRRDVLRRSSPVAARLAADHGIDVRALAGSGRNGRVTKRDVLAAAAAATASRRRDGTTGPAPTLLAAAASSDEAAAAADVPRETPMHTESPYRHDPSIPVAGAAAPAPTPTPTDTAITGASAPVPTDAAMTGPPAAVPADLGGTPVAATRMRRAIGDAVRRSLDEAAHCTTVVECDMGAVERERRELGLTALPLVAHAVVRTLARFPALNATFDGGTVTRYGDRVHLGIAVSLGDDGLIAPVIHDAQDLSVAGLARRIRDLATRARAGRLAPDEVRGGTFTLTNPGAAGALMATPVISLPQVAILDLEAIVRRPVVLTAPDGTESIGIRPMVHLCMGWDHRALDGLYAAQFLTALRGRLEG